ncbi:c-type cytochrome biogenesis protein CcsB [Anaerobranca gottschalkii]|uniref:Cytochrome c-type biogenesis protein CcsB n=1 Tax=Anaerobranca gottschalkii DSM 13577 TaxID=1120990 RepID=A0A1I0ACH2_9FIRM|nr:c-type cytochrome biogenesis protein CcsB [Anaerobranca gottschalkii]SES91919.1 cytochrome c-type biogenesis protein CcsB [Anaerobranca gottschalkii DSM 13577]
MLERVSFNLAYILYTLSLAFYLGFLVLQKLSYAKWGYNLLGLGWIFHTISILSRWIVAGRPPLANQFEFSLCFAWGISLCFLVFSLYYKYPGLGIFILPVILLITTYATTLSREINPLMPALQSKWLLYHVFTAVFSYGAFGVAFGLGILYLVLHRTKEGTFIKNYLPKQEKIEPLIYKTVTFGFLFLTLVIISGAVWAQKAWTRYWAWDPKETWSLITWIIYAVFLHVRINKKVNGKTLAWFSIFGFISVLFTYMGVNILLPSLHSYL